MSVLQKYEESQRMKAIGYGLLIFSACMCLVIPFFEEYHFDADRISLSNQLHSNEIVAQANARGMFDKSYTTSFSYTNAIRRVIKAAQHSLAVSRKEAIQGDENILDNWKAKEYLYQIVRNTGTGAVTRSPLLFLLITLFSGIAGGICLAFSQFSTSPGSNNHIYHSTLTKGIRRKSQVIIAVVVTVGILCFGYFYMQGDLLWPLSTMLCVGIIIFLVFNSSKTTPHEPTATQSLSTESLIGILLGAGLIGFYIILYWIPSYAMPWISVTDPLSKWLNGNVASQWFLYGLLYTLVILVMGARMLVKYRHNTYQVIRTCSVMFFQTGFAFLIPEILVRLNKPYFDFKNIWPLNYTFFFDWNLNSLIESGGLGLFMLVWGIALIVIAVPVFTYFYGKRWYCSWVCGCGGLAETLGDPFRQLSDKSLKAWRYERWIVHGVLVFAVVMTAMVLYTYFSGTYQILFINSDSIRTWYGFLIGSAFAGVVGTGFYPLMGNRVWCRFGCPLAAYLGLIQRFKSRFRITVNGGQCISCGNCSTYCEMGIDVRHYAQRGQDIVRSSCVGCGICASVCPRGVLRLENVSDISQRTVAERAVHIQEGDVRLLG